MTAVAKLLPCPFCGSDVESYQQTSKVPDNWAVRCDVCGAQCGPSASTAAARYNWNTRALSTPRAAEADWQPIETAPRDGTRVLGTVGDAGQQVVVEMEYKPKLMEWHRPMQCGVVVKPTHWRLLPTPSSAKGENK